jgi:hypothetical protein
MFICVRPAAFDARTGWSTLDDAVSIGKQLRSGGVCCLHLKLHTFHDHLACGHRNEFSCAL